MRPEGKEAGATPSGAVEAVIPPPAWLCSLLPARPEGRRLLLLAFGALGLGLAFGGAAGASRLGLFVPPATAGSFSDAAGIFTNNLEPWALLVAVTLLQPEGVPRLSPGFLPGWLADLAIGLALALNLLVVGGVLGALGMPALVRIAPHAPLEFGGYLILIVAYLRARRRDLTRFEGLCAFAISCLMLAGGAVVESYVSGGLQ